MNDFTINNDSQGTNANRKTKIVATVGPASIEPRALEELLRAGVDVVRLNLSHGKIDEHLERLKLVRATADRIGRVVAVLADLPGPKVRAGSFGEHGVTLAEDASIALVVGNTSSTAERIEVDYPTLLTDLDVGDRLVIGDGAISVRVTSVDASGAYVRVVTGGKVAGRPGVHLPSTRLRLTTPTEQDLVLARRVADAGADFVAVSFVRSAADLVRVRDEFETMAHLTVVPKLVAKIETTQAVDNLAEIVREADAVMVARGDLGIDCDLADVPHIQKKIIRRCVEDGVPVITATQMLETMITAPSPTRAEVSDVANAVFDGTDAVMLSAETAVGHDPALVVETMADICVRAEQQASYRAWASRLGRVQLRDRRNDRWSAITAAITHAAWQAAEGAEADAIICCTRSGSTARSMARFRPLNRLIAAGATPATVRSLTLSWGIVPLLVDEQPTVDQMVWVAVERTTQVKLVSTGDLVVVLAGTRPEIGAPTDLVRIVEIR